MSIIDEICGALGEYHRVHGRRPQRITVSPGVKTAMMNDIRASGLFRTSEKGETFEGLPIDSSWDVASYKFT